MSSAKIEGRYIYTLWQAPIFTLTIRNDTVLLAEYTGLSRTFIFEKAHFPLKVKQMTRYMFYLQGQSIIKYVQKTVDICKYRSEVTSERLGFPLGYRWGEFAEVVAIKRDAGLTFEIACYLCGRDQNNSSTISVIYGDNPYTAAQESLPPALLPPGITHLLSAFRFPESIKLIAII